MQMSSDAIAAATDQCAHKCHIFLLLECARNRVDALHHVLDRIPAREQQVTVTGRLSDPTRRPGSRFESQSDRNASDYRIPRLGPSGGRGLRIL